MAEVKLTYDGNLFDIPGGRTDGREPATRTAERETFEESGYQAWTSDQAVMTRNRNSADQKYQELEEREPKLSRKLNKGIRASKQRHAKTHPQTTGNDDATAIARCLLESFWPQCVAASASTNAISRIPIHVRDLTTRRLICEIL